MVKKRLTGCYILVFCILFFWIIPLDALTEEKNTRHWFRDNLKASWRDWKACIDGSIKLIKGEII